eukprot:TRINITY_DN45107_c0_g1_i1.p1 TRINITY_DN45107_c0_g1~~TRINITY_DN45107_c0_g1_i1.p1  ORF type:complete len:436 (+),score=94.49 TRINITY_DN45107_c0_g1_i1:55-1308(+)
MGPSGACDAAPGPSRSAAADAALCRAATEAAAAVVGGGCSREAARAWTPVGEIADGFASRLRCAAAAGEALKELLAPVDGRSGADGAQCLLSALVGAAAARAAGCQVLPREVLLLGAATPQRPSPELVTALRAPAPLAVRRMALPGWREPMDSGLSGWVALLTCAAAQWPEDEAVREACRAAALQRPSAVMLAAAGAPPLQRAAAEAGVLDHVLGVLIGDLESALGPATGALCALAQQVSECMELDTARDLLAPAAASCLQLLRSPSAVRLRCGARMAGAMCCWAVVSGAAEALLLTAISGPADPAEHGFSATLLSEAVACMALLCASRPAYCYRVQALLARPEAPPGHACAEPDTAQVHARGLLALSVGDAAQRILRAVATAAADPSYSRVVIARCGGNPDGTWVGPPPLTFAAFS